MGRAIAKRATAGAIVVLLLATTAWISGGQPATAGAPLPVPGTGVAHPRVMFSPGDEPTLARSAHPRALRHRLHEHVAPRQQLTTRARSATCRSNAQRDLSRAGQGLRLPVPRSTGRSRGGSIVPFRRRSRTPGAATAFATLLLNLFPRSRLAVPAPIGGWDRDISTSEEITNYATAFDTMLGAGYDFGADRDAIVDLLASVTDELYQNYVDPSTAGNFTDLHQNNHRSKTGAAMALAADRAGRRRARQARRLVRLRRPPGRRRAALHARRPATAPTAKAPSTTGYRCRTCCRSSRRGSAASATARGRRRTASRSPRFGRHPLFRPHAALDARHDPARRHDGADRRRQPRPVAITSARCRPTLPDTAAAYWRWADTPQPFETDGSIELGPDAIVAYDDAHHAAAARGGHRPSSTSRAARRSLRSDWTADAVMAMVLGEHDTASEFGRDRWVSAGAPQSHEHADGGSFLLHAFGERLALDPGLPDLHHPRPGQQARGPQHGPGRRRRSARLPRRRRSTGSTTRSAVRRPRVKRRCTTRSTAPGFDATSVATWYRDTEVGRRFLLADDRYLVVGDKVRGSGTSLTWMQHGNGGGTSGGTFASTTPAGGGRSAAPASTPACRSPASRSGSRPPTRHTRSRSPRSARTPRCAPPCHRAPPTPCRSCTRRPSARRRRRSPTSVLPMARRSR